MEYKVFLIQIQDISSPIIAHFSDKIIRCDDGVQFADCNFDKPYKATSIIAIGDELHIHLEIPDFISSNGSPKELDSNKEDFGFF